MLTNQNLVEKQIANRYGRPCMIDKHFISVYIIYFFFNNFLKNKVSKNFESSQYYMEFQDPIE